MVHRPTKRLRGPMPGTGVCMWTRSLDDTEELGHPFQEGLGNGSTLVQLQHLEGTYLTVPPSANQERKCSSCLMFVVLAAYGVAKVKLPVCDPAADSTDMPFSPRHLCLQLHSRRLPW
ncbi:hypothetical protein TREES_T100008924 [Tupaia chinensis]|uniref:Uncharacterized protein n=1 Tax=Tupaia chinensis TaxID=246437 RepID=L9KZJ4_TUPCH|nr:hypothetical protein TREES_T100008924 [Tupaia chinensis]